MKNYISLFLLLLAISACSVEKTAPELVELSIEAYGGDKVFNSELSFDFRNIHYTATYNQGKYKLERIFEDSISAYHDVLDNDGFVRKINNEVAELDEEWTGKYSRSVNSVVYFFRIPFVLKDPAVNLKLLDPSTLEGQNYYKLEVTFDEEGGGDDFDDRFVYWINQSNYEIDYMAYSYSTDGGGKRFRKAINARRVNGLLVKDYINYKPKDLEVAIDTYDTYLLNDGLEELSRIENENVKIEYL